MSLSKFMLMPLICLVVSGCGSESQEDGSPTDNPDPSPTPGTMQEDLTDDVVEIAVRVLNEDQDVSEFESARDDFVSLLREQEGVSTDREFEAFLNYSTFASPDPAVFIGMTQYDSIDAFQAASAAIGTSPEANAFFATFTPELFTVLVPLESGTEVDLAGIADEPGQVLEVAVRDFGSYENFDADMYAEARDAFLEILTAQDGVVAEYQWISALDPNIAVGMTVYASQEAFWTVGSSEELLNAPETAAFLGSYPPITGYVSTVVR